MRFRVRVRVRVRITLGLFLEPLDRPIYSSLSFATLAFTSRRLSGISHKGLGGWREEQDKPRQWTQATQANTHLVRGQNITVKFVF